MNNSKQQVVNGNDGCTTKTSARLQSSMDAMMLELSSRIGAASVGIERLSDKLKPVLREGEPQPSFADGDMSTPQCDLEIQIRMLSNRVGSLSEQIHDMLDRVCL